MSRKKINNQLESLFAELEQEAILSPASGDTLHNPSESEDEGGWGSLVPVGQNRKQPADGDDVSIQISTIRTTIPDSLAETKKAQNWIPPSSTPLTSTGRESVVRGGLTADSSSLYSPAIIATPFQMAGENIGLLEIVDDTPGRQWSEDEKRLVEQVVDQLSLALENAHLYQQEQHRRQVADTLRDIAYAVGSTLDLMEVIDRVIVPLSNLIGFTKASFYMVNNGMCKLLGERLFADSRISEAFTSQWRPISEEPLIADVIKKREPLVVEHDHFKSSLMGDNGSDPQTSYLGVPLIAGAEVVGIMILSHIHPEEFTQEASELVSAIGAQTGVAIQNARLFEQAQDALTGMESLYQASADLNAIHGYDELLEVLRSATLLGHPQTSHVSVNLFDRPWTGDEPPDHYLTIARWSRSSGYETPDSQHSMQAWLNSKELLCADRPTMIEDISIDPRLGDGSQTKHLDRIGIKSILLIPLVVGGSWIGHISTFYTSPMSFPEGEIRRLMSLSGQAATAIQNLHLLDETRRRAAQLETAAEIARDTSGTLALETLLKRAVNLTLSRYGYDHASIFLVDDAGANVVVREATGEAGEEMKRLGHKLPVGSNSVVGQVAYAGKPIVVNDAARDHSYQTKSFLKGTRSELGIPMMIGRRVIGVLDVHSNKPNAFTSDNVSVLQTLADQIAVAVDNARSYEVSQQAIEVTRQRVQELSVLFNVSQAFASAILESEEIGHIIAHRFVEVMHIPLCSIYLIDRESGVLNLLAEYSNERMAPEQDDTRLKNDRSSSKSSDQKTRRPLERVLNKTLLTAYPATIRVIESLIPLIIQVNDPRADPAELAYMNENQIATLVIIPLAVKGQALGVIELAAWDNPRNINPEQLNLSMTLANAAAVALENARLYDEQRRTADKLREVDKLKSQFLANMSHELRTPLNSIIGFSRVILKGIDGPITEVQEQDLNAINSAGQHLLHLINDILDISKIEAGRMELTFEDHVDIADLINSVLPTGTGLLKDKPIRLDVAIPPGLPPVRADVTRIRQVLINFISNAAKFTEDGAITISADMRSNPDGSPELFIKVTDTGIGISPEDQKKLFLPFSQVDASPTRKTGGSGLGLSISRLLVEMHNGRIGVESDAGKGSTFYFTLPVSQSDIESHKKASDRCILAIDDDLKVINLYDRFLKEQGFWIYPLTDASKAVEKVSEIQPFAVLLDILMPSQDGWSALHELKNNPATRQIPVIICSILEEGEKGFSLGVADYLAKPIREEDLLGTLARLDVGGEIHEILVVDDDVNDLLLIEKVLQAQEEYHINLALGGKEGLAALEQINPQAVIVDLFMPGLDGFTLLGNMRAKPNLRDLPVIIYMDGELTDEQRKHLEGLSTNILSNCSLEEGELVEYVKDSLARCKYAGKQSKEV